MRLVVQGKNRCWRPTVRCWQPGPVVASPLQRYKSCGAQVVACVGEGVWCGANVPGVDELACTTFELRWWHLDSESGRTQTSIVGRCRLLILTACIVSLGTRLSTLPLPGRISA